MHKSYVKYNTLSDIPQIHKTQVLSLLSGKEFEVQSAEKATCLTCATHGYDSIDTVKILVIDVCDALEILRKRDLSDLRAELMTKVNNVKMFLVSGFRRGCMKGSPGKGSKTTTHCANYASGDVQSKSLSSPCSHSSSYENILALPLEVF